MTIHHFNNYHHYLITILNNFLFNLSVCYYIYNFFHMANVQKNIIINNLSVSSDAIYNHSNNSSFSSLKENYTCRICLEKEKANNEEEEKKE